MHRLLHRRMVLAFFIVCALGACREVGYPVPFESHAECAPFARERAESLLATMRSQFSDAQVRWSCRSQPSL